MSSSDTTVPDDRPFAVVTGASSGIGRELALTFAREGFDVLLAAEGPDVRDAADEVRREGGGVDALQVDLATGDGVDALYARIRGTGRPVDALALNAGFAVGGGPFLEQPLEDHLRLIALNVTGVVHLARHVAEDMVARGAGRILVTSSVAAAMPGPYYTTYAASKSFVQSFAEALRQEVLEHGVSVTALQPGPTDTPFFERAGMEDTKAAQGPKDDPADVARAGYEALMRGDDHVVVGLRNKAQVAAAGIIADPLAAKVHASQSAPKD